MHRSARAVIGHVQRLAIGRADEAVRPHQIGDDARDLLAIRREIVHIFARLNLRSIDRPGR